MMSNKLPPEIILNGELTEIEKKLIFHNEYLNLFTDNNSRIKINNIYYLSININPMFQNKHEAFWHLICLDKITKYSSDMCINHVSKVLCHNNCDFSKDTLTSHVLNAIPCIYRGMKVHWIKKIIELYNNNDSSISSWRVKDKNKQSGKISYKLKIRFIDYTADYIIVLKEIYGPNKNLAHYKLITAFPVTLKDNNSNYNKQLQYFISTGNAFPKNGVTPD